MDIWLMYRSITISNLRFTLWVTYFQSLSPTPLLCNIQAHWLWSYLAATKPSCSYEICYVVLHALQEKIQRHVRFHEDSRAHLAKDVDELESQGHYLWVLGRLANVQALGQYVPLTHAYMPRSSHRWECLDAQCGLHPLFHVYTMNHYRART